MTSSAECFLQFVQKGGTGGNRLSLMADTELGTSSSDVSKSVTEIPCRNSMYKGKVVSEAAWPVVNDSQCEIWVQDDKRLEISRSQDIEVTGDEPRHEENQETTPEKHWSELNSCGRILRVTLWIVKPLAVILLLYFFVCSLNLLSSAFRLVGGKVAGSAFSSNAIIQNPIAGLMIGILATVLVQSSSTSTSIVVAMVSSGIMPVRPAIPIIMGANIGTSVTNTIVSLVQSSDRKQFELAFAGATVHDMFNWLAVIVLLPLEVATGCLYHLTNVLVTQTNFTTVEGANRDILKAITKPLTNMVVQLDKKVIEHIALGHEEYQNVSLLKQCGATNEEVFGSLDNMNITDLLYSNGTHPADECWFVLKMIPLSDLFLGLILMAVSLTLLCVCLVLIVKILNSALKGTLSVATRKFINKDLPGCCSYFTGYLAIVAGAGLTIVVQSSSVFTSTLTPLVGLNILSLERMYPLTLGSNIGTTTTGLLAAMAASGDKRQSALQIALVHLFFNIIAILIFYPIPRMRFPLPLARLMGRTTATYRWFAVFYLVGMFFLLPGSLFALSMAGPIVFMVVLSFVLTFILFLVSINLMKKKYSTKLSPCLKRFIDAMPLAFYSLAPIDRLLCSVITSIKKLFCCCKSTRKAPEIVASSEPMLNTSGDSNGLKLNESFLDAMSDNQRLEYESTVRSLEEVKVMLTTDIYKSDIAAPADSGYVTQLPTPFLSKYPSTEDFTDI